MDLQNYLNEIQDFDDASQKQLLAEWKDGAFLDIPSMMQQTNKSLQDFINTQSSRPLPNELGETIRGMSNVSPLATCKFYNQNSNEIASKYFVDGDPPEKGTFTYVSDIRSDLTQYIKDVKDFYYYEKQDVDHFAFKVILFSSTEATKLKECFEVCKPKGREVLMFVEDNKGDTSGTYGAIRFSEELLQFFTNKDKQYKDYNFLSYDLQDNKNVYEYLRKSVPGITEEQLNSLFHKGYIEDKRIGLVKDFFHLASAFSSGMSFIPGVSWLTNDVARTAMSTILGKAIQLIEKTRLEENRWQPAPPKKENGEPDENYRYEPLISSGKDENGTVNITQIVKILKDMLEAQNFVMRNILLVRKDFTSNTKATGILEFLYAKYLDSYDIALGVINGLKDLSEMEFLKSGTQAYNALLCGIWNGLIDAVSGLFALVKMLYDGITLGKDFVQNIEKYLPILLEQYDETIEAIKNISFSETAKYLYSKLKEINLTFDPVACAYFTGYVYGFIISLIIEIVLTVILTGGTVTVPLIIEKLEEAIFGIFRLGWGIAKGTVKAVRTFARFVIKSIEDLIQAFQELLRILKGEKGSFKKIIDEVFEASNIKKIGYKGGKILSEAELEDWAKLLMKKYGTKLLKVDKFDDPEVLASFDPNTNTIRYTDDVTEYLIAHEHYHAEEMSKIGFSEYVKDAPLAGIAKADYTTENWINRYKREKYVYDQLVKNAKIFNLNDDELYHAFIYLDYEYIYQLEIRNIKIPK
ncbi:zincin-like metallopeptidase toxin domain-containing protein [Chryseobacterium sp. 'Rf worker isolate 10']|uniref:zincin-like metallopeptidase toxin domain-containing protein n=1 Tax=Chryseobacterium sp. 'Rf worker isolate 10' TaxID=2887348 RepID=UPI003D6F495F